MKVRRLNNELCHHGIKGQRWGVRRYQNPDGSLTMEGVKRYGIKNVKKSKMANLEKWGKDKDHNILYIAGYSGSGKSTTAVALARKNDKIIHLDLYFENIKEKDALKYQDKAFNNYLDKKCPDWREISRSTRDGKNGTLKKHSKEFWDLMDQFDESLENFGKVQYKNKNKVIVEGVQIADDTLKAKKDYYADKPMIILGTKPVTSINRAFSRDGRGNLIKGLNGLDSAKEYIEWYSNTSKNLNDLSTVTNAKKGKEILMKYRNINI